MFPNLKAEMSRKNITQNEIANLLDIHISTMSDKMNGKKDFKFREMKEIRKNLFPELSLDYLFETKEEQKERQK